MSWKEPKTDWVTNPKNPRAEDFNRIEGNIKFVKNEIESKKGVVVDAMNEVGLESEFTDTYQELADKITSSNQGTKIYTPGASKITVQKGFHSGEGYVRPVENLTSGNIRYGATVGGVTGSFRGNRLTFIRYHNEDTVKPSTLPSSICENRKIALPRDTVKSDNVYLGWMPDGLIFSWRNHNYKLYTDMSAPSLYVTSRWTGEIRVGDYVNDNEIYLIGVEITASGFILTFKGNRHKTYDHYPDMTVFAYQLRS